MSSYLTHNSETGKIEEYVNDTLVRTLDDPITQYFDQVPATDNERDIGKSDAMYKDIYIKGSFHDGTISKTLAQLGGESGASALSDLTDVGVSDMSDGDVLTWDDANSQWANAAPTGGSGTPAGSDGDIQINSSDAFGALVPQVVAESDVTISNSSSVSAYDCNSTTLDETADYVAQVDAKLDAVIYALQQLNIFDAS